MLSLIQMVVRLAAPLREKNVIVSVFFMRQPDVFCPDCVT